VTTASAPEDTSNLQRKLFKYPHCIFFGLREAFICNSLTIILYYNGSIKFASSSPLRLYIYNNIWELRCSQSNWIVNERLALLLPLNGASPSCDGVTIFDDAIQGFFCDGHDLANISSLLKFMLSASICARR
jgi:hypothetical protein